jgi:hypothetical protein
MTVLSLVYPENLFFRCLLSQECLNADLNMQILGKNRWIENHVCWSSLIWHFFSGRFAFATHVILNPPGRLSKFRKATGLPSDGVQTGEIELGQVNSIWIRPGYELRFP